MPHEPTRHTKRHGSGTHIFALFLGACVLCGLALAMIPSGRTAAKPPTVRSFAKAPAVSAPAPKPVAAAPPPKSAVPGYVVRRVLRIDKPMVQGDYYWDESGAPAGPVVVTVDLAAQTVSVFRAGYEIGTAVIIYGSDTTPTPLGVFPITQKDADHVSNIYDAPMPYMLRLTNDGISIHGSEVGDGYVTHGCVGVPTAFARKMFDAVKLGDRVIITRGEMLSIGGAITAA